MKTLIIHPEDDSTFFLDIVYKPIQNKTVITKNKTREEIIELIINHDRIMMMGHGSPNGLFSVGKFVGNYVIDDSISPYLMDKKDNVYIWCNADKFVNSQDLKGFYSGMFISEYYEGIMCNVRNFSQGHVDYSNYGFCYILSKYINENTETIYENVKKEYGEIALNNKIAHYNNERLYMK